MTGPAATWLSTMLLTTGLLIGCGEPSGESTNRGASPTSATGEGPAAAHELLVRRADSGLDFHHENGASGRKYLPEINSGCVALLDHDGDGRLDVFLGQGAPLPGHSGQGDFRDRLYRNLGDLRFEDVTETTHATEDGYTFHAAAPDIDADGDPDLYLSNFQANRWLRNDGGVFRDDTASLGGDCDRWSTCAAFADFDRDGDLDVYVANYCVYPLDHAGCGQRSKGPEWLAYCNPDEFPGAPDVLYRNDSGRLVDATAEAGMAGADGTGLGLVVSDYDDDGDVDLFVANDGRPNYLWQNQGGLRFTDAAPLAGVAVAGQGLSEACMGTDFADVDLDGDFDLLVANLAMETNTLYENVGGGMFEDRSTPSGLGPPSLRMVGFGCELFDLDNDGDADAMVANGHILDNVELYEPSQTFRQPPHLYRNDGGVFREVGAASGEYFRGAYVGRGLVTGDLDDDGDLDVIVVHNGADAVLLENRATADHHWIGLRLIGQGGNRDALGARVTIVAGGRTQVEEVRGTSSYSAFQDLRVYFGLGGTASIDQITVRWPDGSTTELGGLAVDAMHQIQQQ